MSSEREEMELRAAIAPLRQRDEALSPPFATIWTNAQRWSMAEGPVEYRTR